MPHRPHENSDIGKAIDLNTLQGSLLEGEMHSLSGMTYSVAEIIYCPGRTILIIEKMPRETARYLSESPPSTIVFPLRVPTTVSGISQAQQQQQQQSLPSSNTLTLRIMGSTASAIVL